MAYAPWPYDVLKDMLNEQISNMDTPNREILMECLAQFQRQEKWISRLQQAYFYQEFENKHRERVLENIKRMIEEDK